jgi:hypothetical protein
MPTYVPTENESMPVPIMMKLGRICVRYGSTLCSPKASDYFGGPGRASLLRSIYLQVHAVILCFTPASAKEIKNPLLHFLLSQKSQAFVGHMSSNN